MKLRQIVRNIFGKPSVPSNYVVNGFACDVMGLLSTQNDQELLKKLGEINDAIRNKGSLVSDNTPGDSIAVPLTSNKNYHLVYKLGNVTATVHKPKFNEFEEKIYRASSPMAGTAMAIKAPGLEIYTRPNIWSYPVFIRFDEGDRKSLLGLHKEMLPEEYKTIPKQVHSAPKAL